MYIFTCKNTLKCSGNKCVSLYTFSSRLADASVVKVIISCFASYYQLDLTNHNLRIKCGDKK